MTRDSVREKARARKLFEDGREEGKSMRELGGGVDGKRAK
jgi:hypothetical protein